MDLDNTLQSSGASLVTLAGSEAPGEPDELARGTAIGRYLLLGKLGAGGMGVVYVAHDPELDRKVALKLLAPRAGGGSGEAGRARLLREAQALAKLSHPNVVAVHDVGQHEGAVWIAMEFVAGTTLHRWAEARPRRWPEVLRVLTDAARGVTAAHAVGLVHRDLKPDNVMIGDDGRVRVMDFGLAHGRNLSGAVSEISGVHASEARMPTGSSALVQRLTEVGSIQGTPSYMAPEQWQGREAEAAADQYGWSVMAWELLYGELPFVGESAGVLRASVLSGQHRPPPRRRGVPGWLRKIVERGLATAPAARWPTMAALLAALERGRTRARVWKTTWALVAVAAVGALAEGTRRWELAQRVADCEAAGATIDATWNDDASQRLRAAFAATGVSYAGTMADRVVPRLERQAGAWKQARTGTCLNVEVRGVWGEDLAGQAVGCLDAQLVELESLVAQFGDANPTIVQKAMSAVGGLDAADVCLDEHSLRRRPPPPAAGHELLRELRAELSRAHLLGVAGNYQEALKVATAARERAEAEEVWRPLLASARALEGALLVDTGAYERAEAALTKSYFEAARAGAWRVAALAASDLVETVGSRRAQYANGHTWAEHAAVAIEHAGDPAGVLAAKRLGQLAHIHRAEGDHARARALFGESLAIQERTLGPEHPDVASTLSDLANNDAATGDLAQAQARHERALAILEKELGPDHPDVAVSLTNLGNIHCDTGAYDAARPLYERALTILERTRGPEHPDVATGLNNLATVFEAEGAYAQARPLYERALTIWEQALGPEHPDVAISLLNLALLHQKSGESMTARTLNERALAIWEQALGPKHPNVAIVLGNLGYVHFSLGDYAQALALNERARAIWHEARGPDAPELAIDLVFAAQVYLATKEPREALALLERAVTLFAAQPGPQRGENDADFLLARALVAAQGDRSRALVAARRARDGYRAIGAPAAKDLADVEQWLAEHAGGE